MPPSKQMRPIRIFLSSPGDVEEERELLQGVVNELDQRYKSGFKVRLDLVRFETFAPEVGPPPQDIVSRNIGDFGDYDIFVGIMWRRFGTPTKRFGSGTEEEFRQAFAAWEKKQRPTILFYFSDEPFSLPSLSPKEVAQIKKVYKFREELKSKGLIRAYPSRQKFADLVRVDLGQKIDEWLKKEGLWPSLPIQPTQTDRVLKDVSDTSSPPPDNPESPPRFSAFVAQVPNDLEYRRFELIDALEAEGVHILESNGDVDYTKSLMAKAQTCIHLLDGSYAQQANEQLDLSASCAQHQILWLSAKVKVEDQDPYRKKLLALGERAGRLTFIHNSDPITDVVDEVKKVKSFWGRSKAKKIFLTYHKVDHEYMKSVVEHLIDRNIETKLSRHDFVGPVMKSFHEIAAGASAIIVCYGQVDNKWVEGRLEEANKARAEGHSSLDVLSVYLAPPPPPQTKRDHVKLPHYLTPIWMDGTEGFDPSSLDDLISRLGWEPGL
jgi:hypothetical protein